MLESEKESSVSKVDVLYGVGDGGDERCPFTFFAMMEWVGCCGYVSAQPHDSCYEETSLPWQLLVIYEHDRF